MYVIIAYSEYDPILIKVEDKLQEYNLNQVTVRMVVHVKENKCCH